MDQPHTTHWADLTQNEVLYLLVNLPPLQNPRSEPLNRLIGALMNHPVLASGQASPILEEPETELLSPPSPEPMIIDPPHPTASASTTASTAATASIATVTSIDAAASQTVDNSARGDSRVSRITDKGKSKAKTPKESTKSKKKKKSKLSGKFHLLRYYLL